MATSRDKTTSIWKVPSGTTWPSTPHVILNTVRFELTEEVAGGAFLSDESYVITGVFEGYARIWRASDGELIVSYQTGNVRHSVTYWLAHRVALQVVSLSYHAASGNIALGLDGGQVQFWQYLSRSALLQSPLPSHACAHERLEAADQQTDIFVDSVYIIGDAFQEQISREKELKHSISELETKCALLWHLI